MLLKTLHCCCVASLPTTRFVIMITLLLTGCTRVMRKENATNIEPIPTSHEIEHQLLNAANSIERSINSLAQLHVHKQPPILNTAPLVTPEGGMGGTASIDWTGPVEPLIQKIAEMSKYRVKVLGNAPAIPIIVSISQENAIIADILKNASLQAGKGVHILVFPANRIIEVRYLS